MFRPLLFVPFIAFAFALTTVVAESFRFDQKPENKTLTLFEGDVPVFTYVYDMVVHEHVPPEDIRRMAGCYIHPLFGLNGEILTDLAPTDEAPEHHYHHRGVFWTWPHVGVHQPDGRITVHNLWAGFTGLNQRFVRWLERTTTEESATFAVENGWFTGHFAGIPATEIGEKVMKETVRVTVFRPRTDDGVRSRAIDLAFVWTPTTKPITLQGNPQRSFGGLTVRFRPVVEPGKALAEPSDINVITIPCGPTSEDLSNVPLPWANYTSRFGEDDRRSGAAIFVPRTHPDFPPSWLTRHYGPLCIGWPGVVERTFQPGEEIRLNYRIWIHDGPVTIEQIERAYQEYYRSASVP